MKFDGLISQAFADNDWTEDAHVDVKAESMIAPDHKVALRIPALIVARIAAKLLAEVEV